MARSLARTVRVVCVLLACLTLAGVAHAEPDNPCDQPGEAPDLITGDITAKARNGSVGGITAFSLGPSSCNVGTCWSNFFYNTPSHPVMAQNMFRLEQGRFEQIGQSWLMHAIFALAQSLCSTGCLSADGSHLGVNCSNPDSAGIVGSQSRLGPKFEVDASTGVFPFPATNMSQTGDAIYKRLQVHNADLDPALNPGAKYWVEVQFVAADDAAAGNQHNNASYRPVAVFGSAGSFDFTLTGTTMRTLPAIFAWNGIDPEVVLADAYVPSDGRFIVGARVTSTGSGYHYEYAVQNLDSRRSAGSFAVPIPAGAVVTDIGFHDVDYHSGEPFSRQDWTAAIEGGAVVWRSETFAQNPNANALRWGTLYNFRFNSAVPPGSGQASLGLFLAGAPGEVAVSTLIPCGDGDADADLHKGACDCDDANALVWETPGEARDLVLSKDPTNGPTLSWAAPSSAGGAATVYEAIRTPDPSDFVNGAACLAAADPASLSATDPEDPPPGGLFIYLIRAKNACPLGSGPLGTDSLGVPRAARACP